MNDPQLDEMQAIATNSVQETEVARILATDDPVAELDGIVNRWDEGYRLFCDTQGIDVDPAMVAQARDTAARVADEVRAVLAGRRNQP